MENKFLIGNEIIETAIAAFTADPCEDTALFFLFYHLFVFFFFRRIGKR